MINNDYFSEINSDKQAYFLGFFIADGCVSVNKAQRCNGRFSFGIQQTDGYILEELAKELGDLKCSTIISNSSDVNRKPQVRLRWTSSKMLDDIKNYNLGPNKTSIDFKFPFDKIPEKYWGSLIRGYIDGDGSFEQHNGVFNPIIVGPNKTWIKQVGDLVAEKTGLIYKIYERKGKTCKWYSLRWSAEKNNKPEKIQKLYNFLYNGAEIWMTRKRKKIEAYLEYRANQVRVKGIWRCNA